MTNDNCLITVNINSYVFLLSEDHKWTVLYYFADFELFATQYVLHISLLLLPNGIKLFETDSLLNIGIHRYIRNP